MKKPLYVELGLFAVQTRKAAKLYQSICLILATLSFIAWLIIDFDVFAGLLLFIAAFWYEVSIRWMDKNNRW